MTTHIMISNVPSLPLHVPHLWLNPNRLMQNGSLITFSETFSLSSFLLGIPGILGFSSETHFGSPGTLRSDSDGLPGHVHNLSIAASLQHAFLLGQH